MVRFRSPAFAQPMNLRSSLWLGWLASLAFGLGQAAEPGLPREFGGATPLQWSARMANSEMARREHLLAWTPTGKAKWDYATGLFTLSLLQLDEQAPNPRYLPFVREVIGSFISPDGSIAGYKVDEYQLDALNPGKTVVQLYHLTGEERFRKAAELLCRQLQTQPRTREGGFWHKRRYTNQIWLDGLYMAAPFYAECAQLFHSPAGAWDDIATQFRVSEAHLYDPASGLFYHGWDEAKCQEWANPATGTSSSFWGRGLGWYGMALMDALDFFPTNHPARPQILATFQRVSAGILRYQDPASGLWYQVLDQGSRPGNYLEASASSMFVYSLAKGIRHGYLPPDSLPAVLKAYAGLVTRLVSTNSDGLISLNQCCSVAGLGFGRDGSYAYYLREPIVSNDLKGIGPFILAGVELQQLLATPPSAAAADTSATAPKQSLFNGRDLTGWVPVHDGLFFATNGVIRLTKGTGWLRSERIYTNFIFEAEWRALGTNYNSGFFVRAGLEGKPFPTNVWQVNLKDTALGSLMRGSQTVQPSTFSKLPPEVWCTFRMRVTGRKLILDINGRRAWEFDSLDADWGYLGLQAENRPFEFRNLTVQELP